MLIELNRQIPDVPIPMPVYADDGKTIESWLIYWFVPVDETEYAAHVADVTFQPHIKRFLQIDGFDAYFGEAPKFVAPVQKSPKAPRQHATGKTGKHPTLLPYNNPQAQAVANGAPLQRATPDPVGHDANGSPVVDDVVVVPSADALLNLSANALRKHLSEDKDITKETVQKAIAAEKARTDAPPRKSWLDEAERFVK